MAQKNVSEVAKTGIAELAKRVPPNQMLQFQHFQAKHLEYLKRVNKQPEKLPTIDWDFYRINVRPEFSKWVDEFKQKYKTMCDKFDARDDEDYSKYFVELQKVREEVEKEVEKFKAESNERIKALEVEYERIKALKPYEEMTAEEYCDLLPEKSMYMHEGRPSFWPHTLEEQSLKPPSIGHGHGDHGDGGNHKKPPKSGGETPGAAPSASGSEGKGDKSNSKVDAKSVMSTKKSLEESQAENSLSSVKLTQTLSEEIKKSNKLVEEEIKHALIYSPFEETHGEERQEVILKK